MCSISVTGIVSLIKRRVYVILILILLFLWKNVSKSNKIPFKISIHHNFKYKNSNPRIPKTFIRDLVEHKFRFRNTKQDLSLPIQQTSTRRPIMVSKMYDNWKILKRIPNKHR